MAYLIPQSLNQNTFIECISSDFISEGCAYGEIGGGVKGLVAGENIWLQDSSGVFIEPQRFRTLKNDWLPVWPHNPADDPHPHLRRSSGLPPEYINSTYDFLINHKDNENADVLSVGMHTDPIYLYQNSGVASGELWNKHLIIKPGIYESVMYETLNNLRVKALVTVPQKGCLSAFTPAPESPYLPWQERRISDFTGDWHGIGCGPISAKNATDLITKSHVLVQDLEQEFKWKPFKVLVKDGPSLTYGFTNVFKLIPFRDHNDELRIISSNPHGYGVFEFSLSEITADSFVFEKNILFDGVSQLHSMEFLDSGDEQIFVTGKRWQAHGKSGDIGAAEDAKILVLVHRMGEYSLYSIDGVYGAGIKNHAEIRNGILTFFASNKLGCHKYTIRLQE